MRCLIAILALTLSAAASAQEAPEMSATGSAQSPPMVFGESRQRDHDALILRSDTDEGDRLIGDLLTESLTIQTPYLRLALPVTRLAEVQMGNPEDAEALFDVVVTVGEDQFSGILIEPELHFRVRGGDEVTIRRELIDRVILRRRLAETVGIPRRQRFALHSGDQFWGQMRTAEAITLHTPYAPLQFDLADVSTIEFAEPGGPATVTLVSGSAATGSLDLRGLDIEVDITTGLSAEPLTFRLHAGRLQTAVCRVGAASGILAGVLDSSLAIPDTEPLIPGSARTHADLDQSQIDAYHFAATAGATYRIETSNVTNADTVMELLDTDGVTRLRRDDDGGVGTGSLISWESDETGIHYVRVWMYGGGPQFLQQFPNGQPPPGFSSSLPVGSYEIWITELNDL